MTWQELTDLMLEQVTKHPEHYKERLIFEISEIEKQGSESIWMEYYTNNDKFQSNPNKLLVPYLLGMVNEDPLATRKDPYLNTVRASEIAAFKEKYGSIPADIIKDSDSPDIDVDCLPEARDEIKKYAIETYGQNIANDEIGAVCSVGTWQTYKFKQALMDSAIALGFISGHRSTDDSQMNRYRFEKEFTKDLPDTVDDLKEGGVAACKNKIRNPETGEETECKTIHASTNCPKCGSPDTDGMTIGKLMQDYPILQTINEKFPAGEFPNGEPRPALIETALNLIGRVRNMGMHAGAIIITDRPLYGNIPLARAGSKGYWVSLWTEGSSTQLSKFGYVKWDLLGLKTLKYVFECCKLIEKNRGISFGKNMEGWDDIDPDTRRAGHYYDQNGNKTSISLDDPHALELANQQKTDGVFQFDTDLAKCVSYDSKITMADGTTKQIRYLDPTKDSIIYLSTNGPKATNNYEVKVSGTKKVKKITMDDGRVMRLTDEHRVLTPTGYKMVADLEPGDEIIEINDYR